MDEGLEDANSGSITDVDDFCKDSFRAIMQVVRSSHDLPKPGDDHEFYSSFSGFREFVAYQKNKLVTMINMLMKANGYQVSMLLVFSKIYDLLCCFWKRCNIGSVLGILKFHV